MARQTVKKCVDKRNGYLRDKDCSSEFSIGLIKDCNTTINALQEEIQYNVKLVQQQQSLIVSYKKEHDKNKVTTPAENTPKNDVSSAPGISTAESTTLTEDTRENEATPSSDIATIVSTIPIKQTLKCNISTAGETPLVGHDIVPEENNDEAYEPVSPMIVGHSYVDSQGEYFSVSNASNKIVKFYFAKPANTLTQKLLSLDDYPLWCLCLQKFCTVRGFPDITSGAKLTPSEEYVLQYVIEGSLGDAFNGYRESARLASSTFKSIKTSASRKYYRQVKDEMWGKISIDYTWEDDLKVDKTLNDMVMIEKWIDDPAGFDLKNKQIIDRMMETLQGDLQLQTAILLLPQRATVGEITPALLIEDIKLAIWKEKQKNLYKVAKAVKCTICKSEAHADKDCPNQTVNPIR